MARANNPKATLSHLSRQMKEKGMPPGALLKCVAFNQPVYMRGMGYEVDKRGFIMSPLVPVQRFFRIDSGDCLVYLDVVYTPHVERHFFRFLFGDKIVGLVFVKGKSFKDLKKSYEIIHSGNSITEEK